MPVLAWLLGIPITMILLLMLFGVFNIYSGAFDSAVFT